MKLKFPILRPTDAKNWLNGNDPDVGKDWKREEKGMTEDKMAGWHHWLDAHKQAPGVGDGQGGLACRSPWGRQELDTTERLSWLKYLWMKWYNAWDLLYNDPRQLGLWWGSGGRKPGSTHCKMNFFWLLTYEPNGDKRAVGRRRFSLFWSIQFMLLTRQEGLAHFRSAHHVVLVPLSALGCEDLPTGAVMGGPQRWQTHLETRGWWGSTPCLPFPVKSLILDWALSLATLPGDTHFSSREGLDHIRDSALTPHFKSPSPGLHTPRRCSLL